MLENIKKIFKEVFDLSMDTANPDYIHQTIISGAEIKGPNAAILILAIIIASIGLNTNSTAVIIGAMLISPLMGGIIAIGYGIAINDLKISRNATIGLLFQVFISILVASIYFHFSAVTSIIPTSEILARTSPATTDIAIAICGGFAGIIGLTRKEKSNVIPGVAIATALMPPLCTVGYGIATFQGHIFLGALYLFFINAFFICLTTIIIVKSLHLPTKKGLSKKQLKKIHRYLIITAIITIIPATFITYGIYEDNILKENADEFISHEFNFEKSHVNDSTINKTKLEVSIEGETLNNDTIKKLKNKMKKYRLQKLSLNIHQNNTTISPP